MATAKSAGKRPAGRKKSRLTEAGDRGRVEAMRALLESTLDALDWNLTATAEKLEMGHPSAVIRAIRDVGLAAEYKRRRMARIRQS